MIYENESGEEERHQDRSSISFIVTARMLTQLAAAGGLWGRDAMLMSKREGEGMN